MDPLWLNSALLAPEHLAFRETVRRFVARELEPHAAAWDEAGEFPRALYRRAAEAGLLAPGFPEAYRGSPEADARHRLVCSLELAQCGAGGVVASLMSHTIALPPVAELGGEALRRRVLPRVLAGEWIAALAVTEPAGGSDVAALRTTARRDGDHYVVDGEKTFITSGMRADVFTVAVRTSAEARGAGGISLLVVEGDAAGLTRTALPKMGWWASDTAHLPAAFAPAPFDDAGAESGAADLQRLPEAGLDLRAHLDAIERSLIEQALQRTGGVVAHAARLLGLRRTTLVEKLRKFWIAAVEPAGATES